MCHNCKLLRCFRNSTSVIYTSKLLSVSSSAPCILLIVTHLKVPASKRLLDAGTFLISCNVYWHHTCTGNQSPAMPRRRCSSPRMRRGRSAALQRVAATRQCQAGHHKEQHLTPPGFHCRLHPLSAPLSWPRTSRSGLPSLRSAAVCPDRTTSSPS